MLTVNQLIGFGSPAPDATVTWTDESADSTDGSSFSFASQAFGTARNDRYIAVAFHGVNTTAVRTVSSVTIGGIAATQVVATSNNGATFKETCEMWIAPVPTGTTGTVAITFSGTILLCSIGVWALYGVANATPTDTGSSAADPFNDVINVNAGGVLVSYAVCAGSVAVPTFTWTNLTERFDATTEASSFSGHSGASDAFATTQTGLSVTADPSVARNWGLFVQAAFR